MAYDFVSDSRAFQSRINLASAAVLTVVICVWPEPFFIPSDSLGIYTEGMPLRDSYKCDVWPKLRD